MLVTHEEFLFADAHAYRKLGMLSATLLARLSDGSMWAVSELLGALKKIRLPIPENLAVFTAAQPPHPGRDLLLLRPDPLRRLRRAGFKYEPTSPEVKVLADQTLPRNPGQDEHRDLIMAFFEKHSAEYTFSVQLCLDKDKMPIEDATKPWKSSPYLPVAKVVYPKQNPYSALRRAYGDDVLSFNSWRGLEAHRPLGSINRLKLQGVRGIERLPAQDEPHRPA